MHVFKHRVNVKAQKKKKNTNVGMDAAQVGPDPNHLAHARERILSRTYSIMELSRPLARHHSYCSLLLIITANQRG